MRRTVSVPWRHGSVSGERDELHAGRGTDRTNTIGHVPMHSERGARSYGYPVRAKNLEGGTRGFRPCFAGVFRLDVVDPPIHAASLNEQLTLVHVLQPARDFVPLHESLVEGCSNGPKRLTPRKRLGSLQARIRDGRFTQPRSRSGTSRQQDHAWWNVRSEGYENLFQQREI
jgi:hypothetical protein